MLAERVAADELPPVADRLPDEPYVVSPGLLAQSDMLETQVGAYGGELQLPQQSPTGADDIAVGITEPMLWAPNGTDFEAGIEGNVVAGYEVNPDNTVFTFHLRSGLKWSDGEPVTMEDVRFAFENVLYDDVLTPAVPPYLRARVSTQEPPAQLEVIDDLTFSLTFSQPYGSFLAKIAIAGWRSYADIIKPRHYLEQFHQKYADPAEFKEALEAESIPEDQWYNLFNTKQVTGWPWDQITPERIGHPTLSPWVLVRSQTGVFNYERNAYYFKVDGEGNQLPYIDSLRSQVEQSKETLTSRALFGEFDYVGNRASLRQMPLIVEQEDKGVINVSVPRQHVIPVTYALNLSYPNEPWRQVVQDIRFRRALSLAMNREEIIGTFFLGEFAALPEAMNPSEYDPDEANRLLDEMGMDGRDDEDFRLGLDGERFVIPMEIHDFFEDSIPLSEMVAEHWNAVGVRTTVRQIDAALRTERINTNDLHATGGFTASQMWDFVGWDDHLPSWRMPAWDQWFDSAGEAGEEPIAEIKELFDIHTSLMGSRPGTEEFADLVAAVKQHYHDHLWSICPIEENFYPTFWSTRVHNVPQGIRDEAYGIVINLAMEQWYIDE